MTADDTAVETLHHDTPGDGEAASEPGAAAEMIEPSGLLPAGRPPGDEQPVIPSVLPVLTVRDSVSFPGTVMPINVGREKSKKVLDLALASEKMIAVVSQRVRETEDPNLGDLYRIGTACRILKMFKLPDGTETIIVHGVARVGIEEIIRETPYLEAKVNPHFDAVETNTEIEALVHNVRHAATRTMELSPNVPEEARVVLENINTPGGLADFLAANLSLTVVYRQELLETFDVSERLRKVYAALASQLEVLELSTKLHDEVRSQMDKSQREYYLREQLKAIQSELGQADGRSAEVDRLREKVKEAKLPEVPAAAAIREIDRMEVIPQASPEYSVALDYVNWLLSLPWAVQTEDNLDLERADEILDADHYGLAKIKRRIVEFLAVLKLNPNRKGSILCFTGPPGVGKTSLGRSIARAMGRKFIRMSLGGMRDEAEIRGHRRTYIGAMPGRIIQEIRKSGARNPVFMLDEVDKIGSDFRGDPAAALLEVLDPQQNDTFTDHYLDVPFDLSNVLFIATANYMDMVPPALRDRMEIISLSSYTNGEKLQIAKKYLVPRQLSENGLPVDDITFDDDAINLLIGGYTHEAGVRELERQIGGVCRALAALIVRGKLKHKRVTAETVVEVLGHVRYTSEIAAREGMPGVVTGLAFTAVGGDILFIEASRMPGRGHLSLTGQLGGVMRESAEAAYSIVRGHTRELNINPKELTTHDLHIHVPAGAIPKDGPSAGVAMYVAMVSALKNKPVDPLTAMTGEITLRGAVLPVGGIREKMVAAHRAGVLRAILPAENLKDLEDVPVEVRAGLEFVPVKTATEALKVALSKRRKPRVKRPGTPPELSQVKSQVKKAASPKRTVAAAKAQRTAARRTRPAVAAKAARGKRIVRKPARRRTSRK
jgi:ATP-dependent Lon protease